MARDVRIVPGDRRVRALHVLREDYERRVAALANRVRGWAVDGPPEDFESEVADRLELEVRREFCRSAVDARLVRVFSPHADSVDVDNYDDGTAGGVLAALDVAAAIGARWFLAYYGVRRDREKPCACGRERVERGYLQVTWNGDEHGPSECTLWRESDGGWDHVRRKRKRARAAARRPVVELAAYRAARRGDEDGGHAA